MVSSHNMMTAATWFWRITLSLVRVGQVVTAYLTPILLILILWRVW